MSEFHRRGITVVRAIVPNPHPKDVNHEEVLLLRRRKGRNAGMWEGPGGKLDRDDTTALVGGVREIEEETGLEVRFARDGLSRIASYIMTGGDNDGNPYLALGGVARVIGGELALHPAPGEDEPEHDRAIFVNPKLWESPDTTPRDMDVTEPTLGMLALYNRLTLGIEDLV